MINFHRFSNRFGKGFALSLAFLFALVSCNELPSETSQSDPSLSETTGENSSSSDSTSEPPIEYEDYYNGYYDSIESWESGEDLRSQLSTLINYNVQLVEFDGDDRWKVNQIADETFDNFDRVSLVYVDYQPLKTYTNTSSNNGWQREHAFAQSLGSFDVASSTRSDEEEMVMRSDFHNLFASDGSLNGSRGNKNLGNVTDEMGIVYNPNDSYGNPSECRAIQGTGVDIFEPQDKDKAMLSRGIFYMATRFLDLNVVEGIASVRSNTHGMLSDLLEWAKTGVDRREYKHNIGVYQYQKNRNPYIDFPELVDYVFGDKKTEAGSLVHVRPSYYDVVLAGGEEQASGLHNLGIRDLSILYQVGHTFSKADDLKAFTVNNDLSVNADLNLADFSVSLSDGYEFASSDIGKMTIDVAYQQMAVSYDIEIEADPSLIATYHYALTNSDSFSAFRNVESDGGVHQLTLGGIAFNFFYESGILYNFDSANGRGRQFGTSAKPIKTMYIETVNSFAFNEKSDVEAIYVVASTAASGVNPKIDVSIGAYSFPQQSMVIGTAGSNTLYEFVLPEDITYQGKVKISFSGFTGGALYLNRFAINAV